MIFFDEIDSIVGQCFGFLFLFFKLNGFSGGVNVLMMLLNEMDGFEVFYGVVVLVVINCFYVFDLVLFCLG